MSMVPPINRAAPSQSASPIPSGGLCVQSANVRAAHRGFRGDGIDEAVGNLEVEIPGGSEVQASAPDVLTSGEGQIRDADRCVRRR